jgi:hypothetical protein
MKSLTTLLGAALVCGALAVQAQTPPAPSGEQRARPTPEQREKIKEAYRAAREACKDNADKRACMTQQMCSKASDPAKCQDHAKERHARMGKHLDERQAAHEACTGKRGEELQKCLGEQRKHRHHHRPDAKS